MLTRAVNHVGMLLSLIPLKEDQPEAIGQFKDDDGESATVGRCLSVDQGEGFQVVME